MRGPYARRPKKIPGLGGEGLAGRHRYRMPPEARRHPSRQPLRVRRREEDRQRRDVAGRPGRPSGVRATAFFSEIASGKTRCVEALRLE